MKQMLSVGQIIDIAWEHYRKHFVELVSISAWFLILAVLYTVSFLIYPTTLDLVTGVELSVWENVGLYLAMFTSLIVGPVLGLWLFIALVKLIDQEMKEKKVDLKQIAMGSWKYFWPLLLVNVLFTLLILAPLVLVLPGLVLSILSPTVPILGLLGSILAVGGTIALLILVVWWAIKYFFIGYSVVLENKKGKTAFRHSAGLVKGRYWQIFWRLVIPKLVFFSAFALIQFFITLIISYIVTGAAGLNMEMAEKLLRISNAVIVIVITALLNPLVLTADYLVFESAKASKEK